MAWQPKSMGSAIPHRVLHLESGFPSLPEEQKNREGLVKTPWPAECGGSYL